jgi:DNA-binding transcriptional LysR family regulator
VDLKQLEYFVRVGEPGSFSKAATALSVAQPFLSKHVRQLETNCARICFIAMAGWASVSPKRGRCFFVHAKKVLDQISDARKELGNLKDSPTGKLTMDLVQQGHGYTILSKRVMQKNAYSRKLQINEIVNPRLIKTMVLATPAQRPATRLLRETADLVATIMKAGE